MNRLDRYNAVTGGIFVMVFAVAMSALYVLPPILFILKGAPWWVWPLYALMYIPPVDMYVRHRLRIKDEADRNA